MTFFFILVILKRIRGVITKMNNWLMKFMDNPCKRLVWALVCGLAYCAIIARFVFDYTNTAFGGGIIMWFFFPAIICGAALLLIKTVKRASDEEKWGSIKTLFYAHLAVIVIGVVFSLDMLV